VLLLLCWAVTALEDGSVMSFTQSNAAHVKLQAQAGRGLVPGPFLGIVALSRLTDIINCRAYCGSAAQFCQDQWQQVSAKELTADLHLMLLPRCNCPC